MKPIAVEPPKLSEKISPFLKGKGELSLKETNALIKEIQALEARVMD